MPLAHGSSERTISKNISEMLAAGHPRDQSVAAAMRAARQQHAFGGVSRVALADGGRPRWASTTHVHAMSKLPFMQRPALKKGSRNLTMVGNELAAHGQTMLKKLGVESGRVDARTTLPHVDEAISQALALEARDELAKHGNAAGWYKEKVEEAIRVASLLHPEIATNHDARSAWAAALAITSQGMPVMRNTELADRAYEQFKRNGSRFGDMSWLADTGSGTAVKDSEPMMGNFAKYDALVKHHGAREDGSYDHAEGLRGAREWLMSPTTGKELTEAGHQLPSGINMDTDTHGSAIFGPKIGGGFYQNLMGNYHPVTQDLWFMRTIGRLAGTLMDTSKTEKGAQKTRDRFASALQAAGHEVPTTDAGLAEAAQEHTKRWESKFRKERAAYNAGEFTKDELSKAAIRMHALAAGVQQDPGSGRDRKWRAKLVRRAIAINRDHGHDMAPADFQATIWYPEKDLWKHLGSTAGEKGEVDDTNVDYSQAYQRIARQRNHTHDAIRQALGRDLDHDESFGPNSSPVLAGRRGPAAAGDVPGGVGGVRPPGGEANAPAAQEAPAPPGLAEPTPGPPPGYAAGPPGPRRFGGLAPGFADGGEVEDAPEQTVSAYHGGPQPISQFDVNRRKQTGVEGTGTFTLDPEKANDYAHPSGHVSSAEITGRFGDYRNPKHAAAVYAHRLQQEAASHARLAAARPDIWTPEKQAEDLAMKRRNMDRDIPHGHYAYWEQPSLWRKQGWDGAFVTEGGPGNPRNLSVGPSAKIKMTGSTPYRPKRAEGGGFPHVHKPHLFHSNLHGAHLHVGPIHSHVSGRTDHLPMHVQSGSYVIPADVVSSHGEGNTIAGFKVMRRLFGGTPYGGHGGPYSQGAGPYGEALQNSRGGRAQDGAGDAGVPIVAAGGEYVIGPEAVRAVGRGDPKLGCSVLDEFVKKSRARNIKTLQKLPGPAKD